MELTQEQKDALFKLMLNISIWRTRQQKADAAVAEADEARRGIMSDVADLEELFPQDEGSPTWVEGAHALLQS